MKTLILSCNTGGGHNSCAKSIKEIYDKNNIECVVKDALAFSSVTVSKVVSNTQTLLYRYFPRVFGSGYRYSEKNEKMFDKGSFWYRVITKGRKKLYE